MTATVTLLPVGSVCEKNFFQWLPQQLLETCENKVGLQELQNHLNAGQSIFTSLQNRKPLKELKVTSNATVNKKIVTQPHLYSTKKKRKCKNNMRFTTPTKQEVEVLFTEIETNS